MKILAISGSTRIASTNTALLQALARAAPLDVEIDVFWGLKDLPVFCADDEDAQTPQVVTDLIERVAQSDGVVIASPEYVHAIPGGLKNAIDWMVSPEAIIAKPVALLHGSHRGDAMLQALRLVLATVTSGFQPEIFTRFPLISKSPLQVAEFFDIAANRLQLEQFTTEFADCIRAGIKR